MKKKHVEWTVAVVLTLAGMAICAHGQTSDTKDTLFADTTMFEKNATSVTDINMGPDSLGMVTGHRAADAHHMVLNSVKTYEYDQPGLYNIADVDKFRQKLNSGEWSCSIHERNLKTGESTDVCSKHRTDGYRESAIITVEKKELTFIHRIEKDGADGHSDVGFGPVFSGLDSMPALMALNTGKMDAQLALLEARLSAGLAGMHGNMIMVPDGLPGGPHDPVVLHKKDGKEFGDIQLELKKLNDSPKNKFFISEDDGKDPEVGDHLGDIQLEMKKPVDAPKTQFFITTDGSKAPEAADPAAPAQKVPVAPQP